MEATCAFLPLSPLVRAGVFQASSVKADSQLERPLWLLKTSVGTWTIEPCLEEGHLIVHYASGQFHQEFTACVSNAVRNRRWYFFCDCCAQPRDRLVLDGERLVCARIYEAEGTNARAAVRRARLVLINEDILRGALTARKQPAPSSPQAVCKTRQDIEKGGFNNDIFHSTAKAFELGHGAADFDIVHNVQNQRVDLWKNIEPLSDYRRPDKIALIGEVPELDLRIIGPKLLRYPGKLSARTMCWGERSGRYQEVLFIADWRGDDLNFMAAHDFGRATMRWQRLALFQQANGRWRFICPVLRKNCDIFYLRNGMFASREAQRVYHRSQRAAGKEKRGTVSHGNTYLL